jgi:hypothetical protein
VTHPAPAFDHWLMFPSCVLIALVAIFAGISGASLLLPLFCLLFPRFGVPALTPTQAVGASLTRQLSAFGLAVYRYPVAASCPLAAGCPDRRHSIPARHCRGARHPDRPRLPQRGDDGHQAGGSDQPEGRFGGAVGAGGLLTGFVSAASAVPPSPSCPPVTALLCL